MEVHTYTLVANIEVSSVPYRKSREGVATIPLRRACYKNTSGGQGLKICYTYDIIFIILFVYLLVEKESGRAVSKASFTFCLTFERRRRRKYFVEFNLNLLIYIYISISET